MKMLCVRVVCVLCLLPALAWAGDVSLAWEASSTPSVTGYRLHYGTASRTYTGKVDVGKALTGIVPNLLPGTTYYFAATAYTATQESVFSNEVSSLVPGALPDVPLPDVPPPDAPQIMRVIITIDVSQPKP